ncbi:MAG: hypothetical protein JXB08_00325 [Bacilli bacterium]|nr:hypothetical protein [Bacilli bacterium]MBN2876821.1 hypothetical protein [Bacilli bacterium]
MLSKESINDILSLIQVQGRMIDYYLLKNLFEGQTVNIIQELKKYQNEDGGFGHGLEPDTMLPDSSIVCTDVAVEILEAIEEEPLKSEMIQEIVHYYESTYIPEKRGWELVPKEVDDFPHAVWWNYSGVDEFGYGNPNPQIVGFLYRYQKYLKTLDLKELLSYIIEYAKTVFPNNSKKHNILSLIQFYNQMPQDIQEDLFPMLKFACDEELGHTNWEEYCLQPYELALANRVFLEGHEELLYKNLEFQKARLANGLILPNWQWYQYDEEFEQVKYKWAGHLTYNVIKALLQ